VKIIKDCTETLSTTCTQQSVQQAHSSAVVGGDTKVGPAAVVADHGTVSVGSAVGVGGYSGGAVIGAAAPVIDGYAGGAGVSVASPVISEYAGAGTGYGISGYAGGAPLLAPVGV